MKIKEWFYRTIVGSWYLDFLIWKNQRNKSNVVPIAVPQAIRQYSLVTEGINLIKRKINVNAASKEEYHKTLSTTEDLTPLAENEDPNKKIYADYIRETSVKKGSSDIETDLDRAKMIEQRINDYKDLQAHVEKRKALREARKNNVKRNN